MYYINARRLLLLCVAHGILHMDGNGNIAIYRKAGKDQARNPEGWYFENIENVCQELMQDKEGQRMLRESLEKKGVQLDDTSEPELIVRPKDVKVQEVTTLRGLDELVELTKLIRTDYQRYSAELDRLKFQMDSDLHNSLHTKRVLFLCLIMAELLQLPHADIETLAWAALYHDTRRFNDAEEPGHGKRAALYYRNNCPGSYDKVTNLIIHYHSLDDQKGYEAIAREIQGQEARERATKLYNIFKDADALDRLRLGGGLREIDVRMLRNPVAQELTLAARLIYGQIKD